MSFQVWHDEVQRWERTGRLDQGPCWCGECLAAELEEAEKIGATVVAVDLTCDRCRAGRGEYHIRGGLEWVCEPCLAAAFACPDNCFHPKPCPGTETAL